MKILFAVRIGNPDWQEELITEVEDRITDARKWAKQNGFNRFRIAEIDLDEKLNFANLINSKVTK